MRYSNDDNCLNCSFAVEETEIDEEAHLPHIKCRRHAPKPISQVITDPNIYDTLTPDTMGVFPDWPYVYEDEWCGEYQRGFQGEHK